MKKLLIGLAVLAIAGCQNDDDGNGDGQLEINEANITGRWHPVGGTQNDGPFTHHEHHCATTRDYQDILNNHTVAYTGFDANCEVSEASSSSWALSGNSLIISNTEPLEISYSYTIQSLTEHELVLKITGSTHTTFVTYYEK